jgi:hypothetical protein
VLSPRRRMIEVDELIIGEAISQVVDRDRTVGEMSLIDRMEAIDRLRWNVAPEERVFGHQDYANLRSRPAG